jgi:hypothetical protein
MEVNDMNNIIIEGEEVKEEVKTEVKEEVKAEVSKEDLEAKKKKDNALVLSAVTIGVGAVLAGLLLYREYKKEPKIDLVQTGKDILEKIRG